MTRKHICIAASLLFISSLLLATSSAATGPEEQHFGPFASTSPDNGTCGLWANDTFDRFFNVHDNGDGTFSVKEQFKNGSFVTLPGRSPGACETDSRHGSTLLAGMKGTFTGYLDFAVSGGTYTPSGCATAAPGTCSTTAGFLSVTFPGGVQGCGPTGVCKFSFEYAAGDQGLLYHQWSDVSDKNGSDLFRGDIANF